MSIRVSKDEVRDWFNTIRDEDWDEFHNETMAAREGEDTAQQMKNNTALSYLGNSVWDNVVTVRSTGVPGGGLILYFDVEAVGLESGAVREFPFGDGDGWATVRNGQGDVIEDFKEYVRENATSSSKLVQLVDSNVVDINGLHSIEMKDGTYCIQVECTADEGIFA